MRVQFGKGQQRKFLKDVLKNLNCRSLINIPQFGFEIPYSTLKNYFNEVRCLPKEFFDNLCYIAKINPNGLSVEFLEEGWGQVAGGKKSKRR